MKVRRSAAFPPSARGDRKSFEPPKSRRRRTLLTSASAVVESLEQRRLLSAGLAFSGGFADTTGVTLSGAAHVNGSSIQLSPDPTIATTGAAWSTGLQDVTDFTTSYTLQFLSPQQVDTYPGDHVAFVIQRNSNTAGIGQTGGGDLNSSFAIDNSVVVHLTFGHDTGVFVSDNGGGQPPGEEGDNSIDISSFGLDATSGDPLHVSLSYQGNALHETIQDVTTGAEFDHTYLIDIPSAIGGTSAYVGFIGDSAYHVQLSSWTYDPAGSAAAPLAPSGLQATAQSPSRIELSWDDNSTAANGTAESDFEIDRSADGSNFTPLSTVPANVTSYADAGLAPSTRYYYRVRAVNDLGASDYSQPASTVTPVPGGEDAWPNFTGFSGLTLNGSAVLNGANLALTTDVAHQAGSAWTTTPQPISRFETTFSFDSNGDGLTFAIQGNGNTALGQPDGSTFEFGDNFPQGFGYTGIPNSVAIKFPASDQSEASATGLLTNGAVAEVDGEPESDPTHLSTVTVSSNFLTATLVYDGQTLTETVRDPLRGWTFTHAYTVDIPAIIGSDTAYVGFTGANAFGPNFGPTGEEDVLSWTYSLPNTTVPPSAPTLQASPTSDRSVSLTWMNTAINQHSFQILRSTDGGNFDVLDTVSGSARSYVDQGLTPGTSYSYRVRALNAAGASDDSNTASATTLAPDTGLDFSGGFANLAGLVLSPGVQLDSGPVHMPHLTNLVMAGDPSGTGGSSAWSMMPQTINRFQTEFSFSGPGSAPNALVIQGDSNTTAGTPGGYGGFEGIPNSVAIEFDTTTTGLYENGVVPADGSGRVTTGTAPFSADTFDVTLTYNGAVLQETIIDEATGATFGHSYIVNIPALVGSNTAFVGFTGSPPGVFHASEVFSWRYAGANSPTVPQPPSNVEATALNGSEVQLTWTDNADNENGYVIYRRDDANSGFTLVGSVPANAARFVDTTIGSLQQSPNPQYRVQAHNVAGLSTAADVPLSTPTDAPVDVAATVGKGHITVTWTPVFDATSYNLYRSTSDTDPPTLYRAGLTAATFSDTDVADGTTYYYRLTTVNGQGETQLSEAASAAFLLPSQPTNVQETTATTSPYPGPITLTWDGDETGNTDSYEIQRSSDGVSFVALATTDGGATSVTLQLPQGDAEYFRVVAENAAGETASTSILVTTPPTHAAPVALYAFDDGASDPTTVTVLDSNDVYPANDGTLVGFPSWGSGDPPALSFTGNGRVHLASDLEPLLSTTASLSVWIKTTQTGGRPTTSPAILGAINRTTLDADIWGYLDLSGRIGMQIGNLSSTAPLLSAKPINDGNWHSITMTGDADTGEEDIYVDGVLSASGPGFAPPQSELAIQDIGATAIESVFGSSFRGLNLTSLYGFSIYDRALTAGEVAAMSAAVNPSDIGEQLQSVANTLQATGSSTSAQYSASGPDASSQVSAFLAAVDNLQVDPNGTAVNITLDAPGVTVNASQVSVPPKMILTINGVTFDPDVPALTLNSGNLALTNCTLITTGNSPTILVNDGSLTLRNDIVQESSGYAQAAIEIDGGSVDLGSASDPGGNTLDVNGAGFLLRSGINGPLIPLDTTAGNTFQINGRTASADDNLQGLVWTDFNNDGLVDFGEAGISNVSITLSGTDLLGNQIQQTLVTDANGIYSFPLLWPGTYSITEGTVPSAYISGKDAIGTAGGANPSHSLFSNISIGADQNGLSYNFGQQPAPGAAVAKGQAAGIGFWANKNGQALINKFTSIGSWLAETMPNTFGVNAGANDLAGMTPAQVAEIFLNNFLLKDKLDAQVMATALNVYATNASLGGSFAASYGFAVSTYGLGDSTWNIGSDGAAFNVADNSTLTVLQILQDWDQQQSKGSKSIRQLALDVFGGINAKGGI